MANIEQHLKSHNVQNLEYKCGVCKKLWPSWRSVITHYSKSSCHKQTSTTPSSSTNANNSTQISSNNVIDPKRKRVTKIKDKESTMIAVIDEESETDEAVDSVLHIERARMSRSTDILVQ